MKILSELSPDSGPLHIVGHADLCALFDISPAALSELKKRGIAVHVGRDRYDLTLTTRAYVQQPQRRFERVPGRRAEALDCVVYAIAARQVVNVNFDEREAQLRAGGLQDKPKPKNVIRSKFVSG